MAPDNLHEAGCTESTGDEITLLTCEPEVLDTELFHWRSGAPWTNQGPEGNEDAWASAVCHVAAVTPSEGGGDEVTFSCFPHPDDIGFRFEETVVAQLPHGSMVAAELDGDEENIRLEQWQEVDTTEGGGGPNWGRILIGNRPVAWRVGAGTLVEGVEVEMVPRHPLAENWYGGLAIARQYDICGVLESLHACSSDERYALIINGVPSLDRSVGVIRTANACYHSNTLLARRRSFDAWNPDCDPDTFEGYVGDTVRFSLVELAPE
ncbi:MAG: hypothetical protein V3V08_03600 [Nannocystaceae bacterium]